MTICYMEDRIFLNGDDMGVEEDDDNKLFGYDQK